MESCLNKIREVYSDRNDPMVARACLYHLLVGGSVYKYRDEAYDHFDLPEPLSIQKMIENLPLEVEE